MKRILSVFLAAALLCLMAGGCANSNSNSNSGSGSEQSAAQGEPAKTTPLEDLSYEIKDNTAIIKGYLGEDTHIVIPETIEGVKVVTIGKSAFEESKIESITLPDTVTVIEYGAFSYCENLRSIELPRRLQRIESSAFFKCNSLQRIEIPAGVTYLDGFSDCVNLQEVILPEGLTRIETGAFSGCTALTHIDLPESLTIIGRHAFSETGLTDVTFPDSVTHVNAYAFAKCENLRSLTMSDELALYFEYIESEYYAGSSEDYGVSKDVFENCPNDITVNGQVVYHGTGN